jgi:outer membrane protein
LIFPTVGAIGAAGVVPAGETQIPGRYGAVGLNVSIPVFNGGLFKARRTEAELRAKAAAENVSDAANRIARDVRVAWLSSIVELSQAQLNFTSAQIANASARFEYQTQRSVLEYQTGVLR